MEATLLTLGVLLILIGLIFGTIKAKTFGALGITTLLSRLSFPFLLILIGLVFVGRAVGQSSPFPLQPTNTTREEQFKLFMSFYYPEIKDLTIHFLTLASSIFAFSVVFAEKIVTLEPPFTKSHYPIIISWVLFATSLVLGGLGLWWLYTAGEIANGSLVLQYDIDFRQLLRNVYRALDLAGFCFVGALIMLAISAFTKLRKQEDKIVSKSA
jgi:hypothetical protein